jgi:hypothetical protein
MEASTSSHLLPVLEELRAWEPIFHTPRFGSTPKEMEQVLAPEYWEVGASGRIYTRDFILQHLSEHPPLDAATAGWLCSNHAIRALGADTYLLTYTLEQGPRRTRRATIWRRSRAGWQILYHQGTLVGIES